MAAVSTDPSDDLRTRKNAGSPRLDASEATECNMESIYVTEMRCFAKTSSSVQNTFHTEDAGSASSAGIHPLSSISQAGFAMKAGKANQ